MYVFASEGWFESEGEKYFVSGFGPKAICTATILRVREKPMIESRIIGVLRKGQIVDVDKLKEPVFCDTIDGMSGYWVPIISLDGIQGWAFDGYLDDLFAVIGKHDCGSLKKLLEAGYDPNVRRGIFFKPEALAGGGPPEYSSLYIAVKMDSLEMVKILLPYIKDVDYGYHYDSELDEYPDDEQSPLERAKSMTKPNQEIISLLEEARSR